jgi:hypothetical protein
MRLRYLGGAIAPDNQPLSNAPTAVGAAAQYQGSFSRQDVIQAETRGLWVADPDPVGQTTVMNINADNAANALQNNTFIDGAQNLPVTRVGSVTQGSFNPFAVPSTSWSVAFDGTDDYLDVTGGAGLALGNGSWTIEFFVYFVSGSNSLMWLYDSRPTSTNGLYPTIYKAADNTIRYFFNSADQIVGPVIEMNKWYHIAVCCDAGINTRLFVNGINNSGILGTPANNFLNGTSRPRIAASGVNATNVFNGYISNLRVLKGTAQYTSNFIPPTQPLQAVANTQLLTCQSSRFVDNIGVPQTITSNGNPTVSTFSPFYTPYSYKNSTFGASLSFSGSSQYLDLTGSANLAFGTGNWTIEFFYYTTTVAGDRIIYDSRPAGTQGAYPTIYQSGTSLFFLSNSANLITATAVLAVNTWYHIAVSKVSGQTRMYLNAAQVGTTYTDAITYLNGASRPRIGDGGVTAGSGVAGNISNLRVLKGTGLYSATTITPPTQPLQAITNTQLLTCQGAIVDSSANAFSITPTGAVAASTSGPFTTYVNQTFRSWPAGSIFCDGTGSYLNLNGSATLAFGSNDFSIAMWVYFNGSLGAANQVLYDGRASGGTATLAPAIYVAQTTSVLSYFTNNAVRITGTTVIKTGQWYYVDVSRTAGSTRMYLNGVQEGATYTDANVYINGASRPVIGAAGDSAGAGPVNGFIYGVQVRNGSASAGSFPSTYPSSSPNTLANTVLYLSGVNAGMYDTVGFTDYQTLGNAQVSTTAVNYGSGSMFFDGTGDWLISTATTNNANPLNLQLGDGDFTIEAWVNPFSLFSTRSIISKGAAATGWTFGITSAGRLQFIQTSTTYTGASSSIVLYQWFHVAVVRSGLGADNLRMYVNGILDFVSTAAVTTYFNQTELVYVGADRVGTTPMSGYMADLRVSRYARYLSNFVPPQATLPKH